MLYLLVVLDRLSGVLQSVNVLQAQLLQKPMAKDAFKYPIDKLLTILEVGDQDIGVVVVHS